MELKLQVQMPQILELVSQLPYKEQQKLKRAIEENGNSLSPTSTSGDRQFGVLKGKIKMADDFDAPMELSSSMKEAAASLQADYQEDTELTAFTSLDTDSFYETK